MIRSALVVDFQPLLSNVPHPLPGGDGSKQDTLCPGGWDCEIHQRGLRAPTPQQREQGCDLPAAQRSGPL